MALEERISPTLNVKHLAPFISLQFASRLITDLKIVSRQMEAIPITNKYSILPPLL